MTPKIICSTSNPESHISLHFALQLSTSKTLQIFIFPLSTMLHIDFFSMFLNFNFKIPRNNFCVDCHWEQKFVRKSTIRAETVFWKSYVWKNCMCTMHHPKMILNDATRLKVPSIISTIIPSPKFHPMITYLLLFPYGKWQIWNFGEKLKVGNSTFQKSHI